MDRTLLERMVGAVVLVLLFVLLAPALLDGSADGDAGDAAEPAAQEGKRTEVIILNAPVNAQPRAAEPPAKQTAKQAARQASDSPRAAPAAKAPPSGFAVQLGSFSERDNAGRYAQQVRGEGFKAFMVRAAASSGPVYRVYSGPAESRAAAEKLAAQLQAAGHNVMVTELGN